MGSPDLDEPRAAGIWTLAGDRLIIAAPGGPATILVPGEAVRLLAVDLPLPSRAKRLAALPFAIEDLIADPIDSLHLALGAEIAPGRYLAGVVRHEAMAGWVALAEEAGLGAAAIVPDVLALPRPEQGWAVDQRGARALVRASDGTGFAIAAALLRPAWEAAGRPPVTSLGEALPDDMAVTSGREVAPADPAATLDLRQGAYAARRVALPNLWRRFAMIMAVGAAAHATIAIADTVMLRSIADRREAEARAAAALAGPGVPIGEDLVTSVTGLLPSGPGAPPPAFLQLLSRVSGALGPLSGGMSVRAMNFAGNVLTIDLDGGDAGLPGRIEAALRGAGVAGRVTRSPDGAIRVTANAA